MIILTTFADCALSIVSRNCSRELVVRTYIMYVYLHACRILPDYGLCCNSLSHVPGALHPVHTIYLA